MFRLLRRFAVVLVAVVVSAVVTPVGQARPAAAHDGAPPGFTPSSTSWTSDQRGWVLGFAPCRSGQCPALLHTFDGGVHWSRTGAPAVRLSPRNFQVRVFFADDTTGVITDGQHLYTTQTAGTLWRPVALPGAGSTATVGPLAGDDRVLYAIVQNDHTTRLYASPLRFTHWLPVPGVELPNSGGGDGGGGDVVAHGHTAYVALNDVFAAHGYWVTTGKGWQPAPPPCGIDAQPRLGLAPDGALYALCSYDPGMGMMAKQLEKPSLGGGFTVLGSAPEYGITTAFSAASATTVTIGAVGDGAAWLHQGTDRDTGHGIDWQTTLTLGQNPISDLTFTDATHGFLMWGGPNQSGAVVYRTTNAGTTWVPVIYRT